MSSARRVGIGLGANLGDRIASLRAGFRHLARMSAGPTRCSRVYETEPVDCPDGAPWFLNAVCEIGWEGEVLELFHRTRAIEAEAGRVRDGGRGSPRLLDIDLLYADDLVVQTRELTLPHPRMTRRRFVLQPLGEIRPEWVPPGETRPVKAMLAALLEGPAVREYPEALA